MKTVKSKPILKKIRARNGTDIFYTFSHWPIEEIDGEKFISFQFLLKYFLLMNRKQKPDNNVTQVTYYMKKDSMEYVK